jgi:hypothetical protein
MKRFHVHVAVHDLKQSVRFYSALFSAQPVCEIAGRETLEVRCAQLGSARLWSGALRANAPPLKRMTLKQLIALYTSEMTITFFTSVIARHLTIL